MNLLLTGACGYTGRGIAEVLRTRHTVRGLDVVSVGGVVDDLQVGDLADLEVCRRAVAGMDALVLCHMAPNPVAYQTPGPGIDTNVKGTANLYFVAAEAKVPRVVLISSMGVAPRNSAAPIAAGDGPYGWNGNYYSLTKIFQECIARYFHETRGIRSAVLRPSWVVYDGNCVTKYGDKLQGYNAGLIDPRDIGTAVLKALDLTDLSLEAFNLGQDDVEQDMVSTRTRLGWRPDHRFEGLKAGKA